MLTIENIEKINGYSLNVKGNSYYFLGWDNTTSDVAHFTLKDDVSASNPMIKVTLFKKGRIVFDDIQKKDCYVYGVAVDGLIFHYTKERLNTPSEFRDTIEQILNAI